MKLMYQPVTHGRPLPEKLKTLLTKSSPEGFPITFDNDDLIYLRGAADAGCSEALILIQVIAKYGAVKVYDVEKKKEEK